MKNYLFGVFTIIIILSIFSFTRKMNNPIPPEKEWIIAPRFLTVQEGITKEEAREWMEKEFLPFYRNYPGWNAMLGEPIKSGGWGTTNNNAKEKGDFVLIYFFDTKETKDHYFPDGRLGDEIKKVVKENQSTWDNLFGKYFVRDKYQNEEYLMFASAK